MSRLGQDRLGQERLGLGDELTSALDGIYVGDLGQHVVIGPF